MTVVAYSGNTADHAIGLIACSRHQSGSYMPGAQHRPKMDFVNPVNGGPAIDYLRRELGYESTRFSRNYFRFWDSEQWTGHTALFARVSGQAAWARGWVPKAGVKEYAVSLIGGGEVPGEWQDDLPMIDDPTSISLEYPVNALDPLKLMEYWDTRAATFTNYCFRVLGPGRCNCAWAAVTVLKDFAMDHQFQDIYTALQKVTVPGQGPLLSQIAGGDLLVTGTLQNTA
jgi:hypothetical protein